jgi:hypothetical protein
LKSDKKPVEESEFFQKDKQSQRIEIAERLRRFLCGEFDPGSG